MADGKVDGTGGGDNIHLTFTDSGGDRVDGADGLNDSIYGYGGNDTIQGGLGNDTIYGGDGNDWIRGNSGDDLIYAGNGLDSIEGYTGNDTIYGGAGRDTLEGDQGNDVIYIGSGDDDIYGGAGNDRLYVVRGTNAWVEGQSGDDTLDFSTLTGTTVSSVNFYSGGNGYVIFANGARMEFRTVEKITGTQDGTVDGTAGADSMGAGFYDSRLDAIGNLDGSDNDLIRAYGGNDTVQAGAGNDTIYGGAGADNLDGGDNDDRLYGGSGADVLYGGAGWDTLHSGLGNDTYHGGTGLDYIDFGAETGGISINLTTGTIGGAAAGDVIGSGIDGVYGSNFNDTITGFDPWQPTGDAFTNVFFGRAGNDIMDGRASPDYMDGGSGDDTFLMTGTPGSDTIIGGEGGSDTDVINYTAVTGPITVNYSAAEAGTVIHGADTVTFSQIEAIYGTAGNDTVNGSTGNDVFYGGAGADSVTANGGSDSIAGGAGADTIHGGAGGDTISGNSGDDFLYGGTGADSLSGGGGFDNITAGSGDDTVLGGAARDTLAGGAGADALYGGSGDDSILGQAQNDTLYGGAGADTLTGGSGDDVFYGGAGIDSITGGIGNDTINAASGDDLIYGGSGDDRVTLTGANNYALYGGEDPGDTDWDILDVSSLAMGGQISVINYDPGTDQSGTIVFTNGDVATFSGFERVICFAAGTHILTATGNRPVETLRPGDMIVTRDHGPLPLRWTGRRRTVAAGAHAPVVIAAGAMGNDRDLVVSQQHRMLVTGWRPDMLFGAAEVLVAAKHLVDGDLVTVENGGEVVYHHLCLDRHAIIYAEGAPTESFLPGEEGLASLTADQRTDLLAAMPELRHRAEMTPARPVLRAFEAELLRDAALPPAARDGRPERLL